MIRILIRALLHSGLVVYMITLLVLGCIYKFIRISYLIDISILDGRYILVSVGDEWIALGVHRSF